MSDSTPIIDMRNYRILKLTLEHTPFLLMVHGWKLYEYRKPTNWILSRLFYPDGKMKEYDYIRFTNGYKKTDPFFYCEWLGWHPAEQDTIEEWARENGGVELRVHVMENDIVIPLGKIVLKGHLKK